MNRETEGKLDRAFIVVICSFQLLCGALLIAVGVYYGEPVQWAVGAAWILGVIAPAYTNRDWLMAKLKGKK